MWTFADRGTPLLGGWIRYHAATAIGNLTNYLVTNLLSLLGVLVYLAYLVGVVSGYVANYIFSELEVFK
jgi:dolichol-phosphate mannosyltransferase